MPLDAVVLDFDGVIANSEPLHFRALRDVLAEEGMDLPEPEYYATYLGYDDVGAFTAIGANHGRQWTAATIAELMRRKAARLEVLERDVSVLFPGAAAAIRRLAAAGPVAVASGALRVEILRTLDRESLTPYFATIVAAEDTPVSKPAPDPYRLAVERLSAAHGGIAAARCVAIEDSRWGLMSARAAGLRTVAVTHTYPSAELDIADAIVANLDALTWDYLSQVMTHS